MAESNKVTSKNVVAREVTTKDNIIVTVIGTEKSKNMVTGKEYQVTKTLADKVIKKGFATLKK